MNRKQYSLFLIIALFMASCGPKEATPVANKYFTLAELNAENNKDKVTATISSSLGSQGALIAGFVRYGLKQVVITYKTKNSDGTDITASGALFIPILTDPKSLETFPLASLQHGTIFDDASAPSKFSSNSEAITGTLLASTGYIVAMPDYIGYGKSNNVPHPYEHRESLAQSSLDFLRAVKEYMVAQKTPWNKNLYIGGYSEGGFASMSLLKMIEEKASTEFTLKAASLGAGAYDKTAFTKYVASNKTTPAAQFNQSYIWVILTYDRIYKLNRAMNTYFKEPYASQIAASKEKVQLSVPMTDMLNETFKKAVVDGTEMGFLAAVKDNDVFDWKPNTPIRLYHGTADDYVNFFNSQNAFDAMKKRGALNITLNKIEGKNHQTSVQDYLLGTLDFFGSNK
jgi:pimeloyl-ACP methyl ester carboxylesterase